MIHSNENGRLGGDTFSATEASDTVRRFELYPKVVYAFSRQPRKRLALKEASG
jgi:hypothetical protein